MSPAGLSPLRGEMTGWNLEPTVILAGGRLMDEASSACPTGNR